MIVYSTQFVTHEDLGYHFFFHSVNHVAGSGQISRRSVCDLFDAILFLWFLPSVSHMEAFQLLAKGGAFDKQRFKTDVQLFNVSTPLVYQLIVFHRCLFNSQNRETPQEKEQRKPQMESFLPNLTSSSTRKVERTNGRQQRRIRITLRGRSGKQVMIVMTRAKMMTTKRKRKILQALRLPNRNTALWRKDPRSLNMSIHSESWRTDIRYLHGYLKILPTMTTQYRPVYNLMVYRYYSRCVFSSQV